jgi:site-specific DNA-cytosine methylase
MNVLSLFDGMSCGQIALERAGIKVDNYFASEIDKYAMQVAQKNYPNTKQIGSVVDVKGVDLPDIDLLIGGSPCQGFSLAGKQLNFEDPRSKLFFEFVRLREELNPKYFLLENVKMKKDHQNIISKYLGCDPVEINSSLVSAQSRKRFYWTNIPSTEAPCEKHITLEDVLEEKYGDDVLGCAMRGRYDLDRKIIQKIEVRKDLKANCLTTVSKDSMIIKIDKKGNIKHYQSKSSCLTGGANSGGNHSDMDMLWTKSGCRRYTATECERLQTVPDNYTEGVSNSQRYKMLGNGWTVDVIAHIFKNLK